jgi:sigma-E factor negative regulatory protein RseA
MKQEMQRDDEWVSALADGQLQGEEFARTVEWVAEDKAARLSWHAYHLVGDVMRSGEAMVGARELDFSQQLKLRLQQEMPLAPAPGSADLPLHHPLAAGADDSGQAVQGAANDYSFRWKLLAGVASLMVVGFVGWQVGGEQRGAGQLVQVQLQKGSSAIVSPRVVTVDAGDPQLMVRDPQLDALLAAHRQSGGGSALAMSTGFLRNAAFEGAGR